MKLIFTFVLFIICFSSIYCSGKVRVTSILRPNREIPTANSFVIYDDSQVLVVDLGKTWFDFTEIQKAVSPLIENSQRQLNGAIVLHAHPDHCTNAFAFRDNFNAPVFVPSEGVQNEMVTLMQVFGFFLNSTSPGNPDGTSSDKFDYADRSNFQIANNAQDIWQGENIRLHHSESRVGETKHFGFIDILVPETQELLVFGSDIIYVKTHIYMGYGLSLFSQCDWINFLLEDVTPLYEPYGKNITLYPGHGPVSQGAIKDLINPHIQYILDSRDAFTSTCDPNAAVAQIQAKYSSLNDPALLIGLTVGYRVPYDAMNLGCDCSSPSNNCPNTKAPNCFLTGERS